MAIRGRSVSPTQITAKTLNTTFGVPTTVRGYVLCRDLLTGAGYVACRNGTANLSATTTGSGNTGLGQAAVPDIDFGTVYDFIQGFLEFDTSGWTGTVTAAWVTLTVTIGGTITDCTLELYARDFGGTVDVGDFVVPASYPATLLGSVSTTGINKTASVYSQVSLAPTASMAAAVVVGGRTRLMLMTDRMRLGTVPTQSEELLFSSAILNLQVANYVPNVTGTLARTEARDTSTATGTVSAPPVTGTIARTEARDTSVATGTLTNSGTIGRTEALDLLAATGVATTLGYWGIPI